MPSTTSNRTDRQGRTRGKKKTGDQPVPASRFFEHEMQEMELTGVILELFCKNITVPNILEHLQEHYPEAAHLKREDIYPILRKAGAMKWLRYHPPVHLLQTEQIRSHYQRVLRGARVVYTILAKQVATEAAKMLLELVKQYPLREKPKQEVHIGFAGGISMRHLASAFAQELLESSDKLPERIVFHSMNAGFDPNDSSTDPNAFVSYFVDQDMMRTRCDFVGLRAPAIVQSAELSNLRKLFEIEEAYKGAKDLDIIVTSGAEWDDPDNSLRVSLKRYPETLATLNEAGCVGDMLWRPLAKDGPIEAETAVRAMTLLELSDLPEFIRKGNHVMLVLGPCGGCKRPKGKLLHTILNQRRRLLTHLVVDSRTAAELVKLEDMPPMSIPAA